MSICCLPQGKSPSEAWQSVKAVYWSVLLRNWVIWGVTQYINMSYVPMKVPTRSRALASYQTKEGRGYGWGLVSTSKHSWHCLDHIKEKLAKEGGGAVLSCFG